MRPGLTRFPRQARLIQPAEYQRVFDQCRCKASDRWMTALAIPNGTDVPRLGLVISRKADRHAVARNRVKRLIRESYRHWQTRLGPVDIVILGRPGVSAQPGKVLDTALEKFWTQLIEKCAGSSSN